MSNVRGLMLRFLVFVGCSSLVGNFIKQTRPGDRPISLSVLRERCMEASGQWLELKGEILKTSGAIQQKTLQMIRSYVGNQENSILQVTDKHKLQKLIDSYGKLSKNLQDYKKELDLHEHLLQELSG